MRYRSYKGSTTAFFVLVLVIGSIGLACGRPASDTNTNVTTSPTPSPDPCAGVPDDFIRYAIYGQIDKDITIPRLQINVWVEKGVVTLTGFVNDDAQKAKVIGIAENTKCVVKPVNVDKFYGCLPGTPVQPDNLGGCGTGWVRCGDICVPDHCFWNDAPSASTTPTPVPSPSGTACPRTPTPTPTPGNNSNTSPKPSSTTKY
jgi:hypothetical protein